MELTVLGCSGSYPTGDTQCSGYLIRDDGFALWMDAGNGTLSRLQRHVSLDAVGAIALSHVHPDHCADLYPFFYAILFAQRPDPVPVIAPPNLRPKLEALIGADSIDRFRRLLDWRDLEPGATVEVGPFRIEAFDAAHSTRNNTMRLAAGGRTLCYSGDTGPNEHLARAAANADFFLCEASWLEEHRGLMAPVHLTATEAGEVAAAAGCARLMLTHIWPENDRVAVREQAAIAWDADVELAIETETTTI